MRRAFGDSGRLRGSDASALDSAISSAVEAMMREAVDDGFAVREVELMFVQAAVQAATAIVSDGERHVSRQEDHVRRVQ